MLPSPYDLRWPPRRIVVLGYVAPIHPVYHVPDLTLFHGVVGSDRGVGLCSGSVSASDLPNVGGSESGRVDVGAPARTAFPNLVRSVRAVVANKEVARVHARRVVARMADLFAGRDLATHQQPRHPMREKKFPAMPPTPIRQLVALARVVFVPVALPLPTLSAICGGHLGPEPRPLLFGEHSRTPRRDAARMVGVSVSMFAVRVGHALLAVVVPVRGQPLSRRSLRAPLTVATLMWEPLLSASWTLSRVRPTAAGTCRIFRRRIHVPTIHHTRSPVKRRYV